MAKYSFHQNFFNFYHLKVFLFSEFFLSKGVYFKKILNISIRLVMSI